MRFTLFFFFFLFASAFGHANYTDSAEGCYFEIKMVVSLNKTVGCLRKMTKERKCGIFKTEDFSLSENNTLLMAHIKETTNLVFQMNSWLNRRKVLRDKQIRKVLTCIYYDIKDSPNRVSGPRPPKKVAYASYSYPVAIGIIFVIWVVFMLLEIREMRKDYLQDKADEKIFLKKLIKHKKLMLQSGSALTSRASLKALAELRNAKFFKIPPMISDRELVAALGNDKKQYKPLRKLKSTSKESSRDSKKSVRPPALTNVNFVEK